MKWDGVTGPPASKAHALLAVLTFLPYFVNVPYNFSIIAHAALTVYIGSWRSVKSFPPAESMTHKDAMRFPLVGSCVLFGLFLLFKFLPKELVNALLAAYIVALGTIVSVGTVLPFVLPFFPESWRDKKLNPLNIPKIPMLVSEPIEVSFTIPEGILGICSAGMGLWYYITKNWVANNLLGLAFSIMGIEHLSLGSVHTATILLSGLFFYDIFWVFCTPVMVSVAKNFEAPIKLLFPRTTGAEKNFAMLGLGDIVIPGLYVALILRHDVERGFQSSYFHSVFWGYVAGLGTTIFVMNYFKAAQPALLYIVPAVLGATALHALIKGEFKELWNYKEEVEEKDKQQDDKKTDSKAEEKEEKNKSE